MLLRSVAVLSLLLPLSLVAQGGGAKTEIVEGTWVPTAAELGGKPFPEEIRKSIKLVIKDGKYTVTVGGMTDQGTYKLNPSAKPKQLDITGTDGPNKGKTILAIYERDGNKL